MQEGLCMDKVFNYKDKYYIIIENEILPIPIPGDILLEKNKTIRLVSSCEVSSAELRVVLLEGRTWLPGKGGKKVWVPEAKEIVLNLSNIDDFVIKRGEKNLYPISFSQKIINFFIKLIIKIKNKIVKKNK